MVKMAAVYRTASTVNRFLLKGSCNIVTSARWNSVYPIDDNFYGLTEQEQQFRQTFYDFAQKVLAPLTVEIDKTDDIINKKTLWKKLGSLGLHGITVSSKYGGMNGSYLNYVLALEEISRACPALALSLGAHSNLCINQIQRNGSEEQKQKYLPKLISGEHIGALAMSEVNAGSDVLSMKLRADLKGDHYLLNGNKFWITNGCDADVLIVYAKTDLSAKPQHSIGAFIVEKKFPGFKTGKKVDKLGNRGSPTCELIFEDCKIPVENQLSAKNKGIAVLMSGLYLERIVLSALCIGIMQSCCDIAFNYASKSIKRHQQRDEFQLIQSKLADIYTKLNVCRSYLYTVVRATDRGYFTEKDSAAVLLYCAQCTEVANDAMQCLGADGYLKSFHVERLLRDSKLSSIGGGSVEIRRLIIGRAINAEF